jgi:hypothetical protein
MASTAFVLSHVFVGIGEDRKLGPRSSRVSTSDQRELVDEQIECGSQEVGYLAGK